MPLEVAAVLDPRAALSAIGIFTLVSGVWYVDRTWDESGSAAHARAAAAGLDKIPQAELDAAFPFPWAFLLGWALYALSYAFPSGSWSPELSAASAVAILASLALGIIASVPMGEAVRSRNATKKMRLSMAFVASWLVLTVSTVATSGLGLMSAGLAVPGAVLIVASMRVLWKHRKMGDSWEQEGRPNPRPVVYNMGGPMFIFGWFLFWLAVVGTPAGSTADVALTLNVRTVLAFVAGCGMVPVVLMLDYAHDEGAEFTGFGTDGRYFGRFLESPLPFFGMWTLFGLASFFTPDNGFASGTRPIILLINCVVQSIVAGGLIQTALYKGQMARKMKLSAVFVLLFASLAINMSLSGGAAWLAIPGAMFVIAGQKTVFGDRKRGDYWMANQVVNPNPVVYSVGEPLFMFGWILLAVSMSQPMV